MPGFVEPAEVCLCPLLEPIWVPLLCCSSSQLGVVSKFSEGAPGPAGAVTDEDAEESQPQHGALWDATRHQSPSRRGATERRSLDSIPRPVLCPSNSPPIAFVSLQLGEKDVAGHCVEGLTEVQVDDISGSWLVY